MVCGFLAPCLSLESSTVLCCFLSFFVLSVFLSSLHVLSGVNLPKEEDSEVITVCRWWLCR